MLVSRNRLSYTTLTGFLFEVEVWIYHSTAYLIKTKMYKIQFDKTNIFKILRGTGNFHFNKQF